MSLDPGSSAACHDPFAEVGAAGGKGVDRGAFGWHREAVPPSHPCQVWLTGCEGCNAICCLYDCHQGDEPRTESGEGHEAGADDTLQMPMSDVGVPRSGGSAATAASKEWSTRSMCGEVAIRSIRS